jgi:hypothetical protein
MRQATDGTEAKGRFVQVLVTALICGVVADVLLVLPFTMSSQPSRMWFAAFGIGALFAAIAAGWVGTLGASDRTRSRLLAVVGTSETTAVVVAVIGFLVLRSAVLRSSVLLPVLSVLFFGLGMAVVALVSSWAALRFRSPRRRLALDILTTFGLLGLMVLVHIKTIILVPLP